MTDDAVPQWLAGRRPAPTFEALLGAAGGIVLLAAAAAFADGVPDDDARVAGLALSLLVLVVGCVLSAVSLGRATSAAGVVLSAGAVVPLAFLLTNDPASVDERSDFLVAALVAVAFWLVLFALGPNRGHCLFLGLALFMLWSGALSQTDPSPFFWGFEPASQRVELRGDIPADRMPDVGPVPEFEVPEFDAPEFEPVPIPELRTPPEPRFEPQPPPEPRFQPQPPPQFRFRTPPPPTTDTTGPEQAAGRTQLISSSQEIEFEEEPRPPVAGAIVAILFGLAYLLLAALLDASRLWRAASATFLVGVVALVVGTFLLGPRYGATAAGGVAIALAALVVVAGVVAGRRAVAWVGAAGLALGMIAVVSSVFDDSPTAAAACLLVVGAAVVTLGLLATTPDADAEVGGG